MKRISEIALPVVEGVFKRLPQIERKVLKFRLGLRGNRPKSLGTVAGKLNKTRVEVRQIESNALRTMRRKMREIRLQLAG